MAILTSDLKAYQSANMPENDTGTSGGAIAATGMVEFTDLAANDVVRVVSTSAGDTAQTVSVTGRDATGAIQTDAIALNGTTPVSGTTTFERILKVVLSATAAGSVTVERNTTPFDDIVVIPPGKTSVRRLFYDSTSEAGATTRFEKIFFKNEHATLTLNAAKVKLTADPSTSIRIGAAASKDDSGSVANRKTSPGVTFVDDGVSQDVPGTTLEAASGIGVWVEFSRGASAAPVKNTFTVELSGTSV